MLTKILILTGIALGIGILIYVANVVIPNKVKGLEEADRISKLLPGLNCGACGYAGCFAYAQAITEAKVLSYICIFFCPIKQRLPVQAPLF